MEASAENKEEFLFPLTVQKGMAYENPQGLLDEIAKEMVQRGLSE